MGYRRRREADNQAVKGGYSEIQQLSSRLEYFLDVCVYRQIS